MITSRKFYMPLLVLFLLFLLISCNSKVSEKQELKAENYEQSENDYKSGKWLEELPAKTPLTLSQLEALVPESLLGMPLVETIDMSKDGVSAIKGVYSLDKDPSKESVFIEFFIVDGAGNAGYKHLKSMFKMMQFPTNDDDGTKILKFEDWNNKRLLTRQRLVKEKWKSEMAFIKDLRYHIRIEGKKLKSEQLREPINIADKLKFPI